MQRRRFLSLLPAAGAGFSGLARGRESSPPFRTLYSNDTTHILSCRPPGPERDRPLTDADLRRSITEAAGVDAHLLQPGLGWIPWWKSRIYPIEAHHDWLRSEHGVKGVNKISRYLLDGGDMLQVLVDSCDRLGIAPFLSFRLNDGHHTRDLAEALERGKPTTQMARHYWDHLDDYRIGSDVTEWDQSVFDWSIAEVRDYKFALIEEACANYDLAGLELDFLRHWNRFSDRTPMAERREITGAFVARVRAMLDRTARARSLPRRWLGIRVPAPRAVRPEQGIDLGELQGLGVDLINLSHSYFTWQDRAVEEALEETGGSGAVYLEMTHCTMTGKATAGSGTQPFLRTTDPQFYTTALLAEQQGAAGVSLFNFPYYRYHATDTIGPFHEPPFEVLPRLKDREFMKKQPRWYFLSAGRNDPILGERVLPAIVKRDEPQTFTLLLLEESRPSTKGLLRLRSDESIDDRQIEVRCGGAPLARTAFVAQPLAHPYAETWLGTEDDTHCYELPSELMPDEVELDLQIEVRQGPRVRLIYIDLVFDAQ